MHIESGVAEETVEQLTSWAEKLQQGADNCYTQQERRDRMSHAARVTALAETLQHAIERQRLTPITVQIFGQPANAPAPPVIAPRIHAD